MKRLEIPLSLAIVLACLICTGRSDDDTRVKKLAPDVIEKTFPDGRRSIVVGGRELADRTPAAEPTPEKFEFRGGWNRDLCFTAGRRPIRSFAAARRKAKSGSTN